MGNRRSSDPLPGLVGLFFLFMIILDGCDGGGWMLW